MSGTRPPTTPPSGRASEGRDATRLVVCSGARTLEGVIADGRAAPTDAILEVRLDRLGDPRAADLPALRRAVDRELLATVRSAGEGGEFDGRPEVAAEALSAAQAAGFEWVDVEAPIAALVPRRGARRIASRHASGAPRPGDGARQVAELSGVDADVRKVAATAADPRTALAFVTEAVAAGRVGAPVTAIAMGRAGRWLRPLAPRFEMPLLYTAAHADRKTAAGQVTTEDAERTYRWRRVGPATRVFAVAGADVAGSLSAPAHNEVFDACGVDAVYVSIDADDFDDVAAVARDLPLDGLSVTAPHKHAAFRFAGGAAHDGDAPAGVDLLDPDRGPEVANTLLRARGGFSAFSTDGAGFLAAVALAARDPAAALDVCVGRSLAPLLDLDADAALAAPRPPVRTALVFGTGGAARAIASSLARRGIRVSITGRDPSAALAAALAVGHGVEALSPGRAASRSHDLLVKAVAEVHPSLFDPADFAPQGLAADVVYSPIDTPFLLAARRGGRVPVPGLLMFVEQAVRQATRFIVRPAAEVRPAIVRGVARALGREAPA